MTVDEFERRKEELLKLIHEKLKALTYRFKPARRALIPKEGTSKMRKLGIPVVMDRVVGQSINLVFAEIFDPDFTKSNYGFRKGKSQHQAISRVQGIAIPVFGEEYAKLRDRGIDPALAIPHAFLVAEGEGLVEEWVISRRFAMFKGAGKLAQKSISEMAARFLWGGTKAYARGLTEEMVQGANRNFWNIVFTDTDQKLLEGVVEEGAAGGLIEPERPTTKETQRGEIEI